MGSKQRSRRWTRRERWIERGKNGKRDAGKEKRRRRKVEGEMT